MNVGTISKRWRILSGQNNWRGLLKPLDLDLRKYLIHYGERAQATYDTFNWNQLSLYAGCSKFAKENLFSKVGLQKGNPYKYKVTKYIYSTSKLELPGTIFINSLAKDPWTRKSNFIGYIAVATDKGKQVLGRRDIIVAWRGTIHQFEWVEDYNFPLVKADKIFGDGTDVRVHRGWLSMYTSTDGDSRFNKTSTREQVTSEIKKLMEQYKNEEVSITCTGHSLGASMATLSAIDIAANGLNKAKGSHTQCPVTAFAYASPKVGDSKFLDLYKSTGSVRVLRIRNMPDIVPNTPPVIGYRTVGEELQLDARESRYLRVGGNIGTWHDLEGSYLHGLAGTHGLHEDFKLVVKRDIALANKDMDVLKYKYLIPPYWWVLGNKGMVQQNDGSWKLFDRQTPRWQDEDEVGSDEVTTKEDSDDETTKEGSDDDTTKEDSEDETTKEGSDDDTTKEGSHDDTAKEEEEEGSNVETPKGEEKEGL